MGVDFYPCSRCGKVYCDCGDYTTCNEDEGGCGRDWCSYECAEEDGYVRGHCKINNEDCENYEENYDCFYGECEHYVKASCNYCRKETFEDDEILEYALCLLNKSKEDLVLEMRNRLQQ